MPQEHDASPQRRAVGPLSQRRLFLSCASIEFGSYRDALAANLTQPGVELRRQEDFVNAGQTTLEKICEYIRTCDAVIHLIGHATGAYPPPAAVEALLKSIPDFVSKLGLEELIKQPGLSYTQWEAWLGLYYGKNLAVYIATDKTQRDAGFKLDTAQQQRQAMHWDCLRSRGRDRKEFVSPHDLSIEVLRAMSLLVPGFVENMKRGEFRDRNLLFAVLAMQDDILSREAFVRVCKLWAEDTNQPIADLMRNEGLLTPEDRALVEARLDRKLRNRSGDIRQSLAECLGSDARQSLSEALDPDTIASLPDRLAGFSGLQSPSGQWRYKLTRTHGIGGLGVVSVADDAALERSVAVKQLKPERLLDPMAVERFIREARITGRLQHPNIVPVYELGLSPEDQIPFYAMRFVGHRTLHNAITEHYSDKAASASDRNLRFRSLIQSFLAVCNAVAFAHEQRVIHRDIKPANIMIGEFGEVILLDWGLAKRTDEPEPTPLADTPEAATQNDATRTLAGVKLGSPAYMAPEQAAGLIDQHGPHTDIYGLGVTLYEVLTGDVPFTGTTTEELLAAIQSRALPNPRERNPAVPPALAAICLKAMEKKPVDRYASAKLLADDIQHWLADESVSAFAEPITLRIQRVARKNPGPASALAATILVGVIGLSGGLYFVNAEKNQKELALQSEGKALKEKGVALTQLQTALTETKTQRNVADARKHDAEHNLKTTQRTLAQMHFERGLSNEREGQHRASLTEFLLAVTTFPEEAPIQNGYRHVLMDRLTQSGALSLPPLLHDGPVICVAFSPDGSRVVTGSRDDTVRLWDAQTGAPIGAVMKHAGSVTCVAFSPDGSRVVTGAGYLDYTARLWDAHTGTAVGKEMKHDKSITGLAFSPDGFRVVTASEDHTARLWDGQTGAPVGAVMKHEDEVTSVAFSPDGSRVLTGSSGVFDEGARLWDARTGASVGDVMKHGGVKSVAFSPDGSCVITGSNDDTARLWVAQTGAPFGAVMKHNSSVTSVAFSPDGSQVVTASGLRWDGTARLWDARTGLQVGGVMKHAGGVESVAFSPDGACVVTASEDGTARLWDARTGAPVGAVMKHDDEVLSVAFSPDGTRVLTGSSDGALRLWDAQVGAPVTAVMKHDGLVWCVAYSQDCSRVVTGSPKSIFSVKGSGEAMARLWDAQTGEPIGSMMKHDRGVRSVAFSPDDARLVTGGEDGTVRLWNAQTGASVGKVIKHVGIVLSLAFSPDGAYVLAGSQNGTARLDAQTCEPLGVVMNNGLEFTSLAFSADCSQVITGSDDGTARTWLTHSGLVADKVMKHSGKIESVAFSVDGSRVVTGSSYGTAQIWNVQTGASLGAEMKHGESINYGAFSPDGSRIVTAGEVTVRLWDTQTGAAVGAVIRHEGNQRIVRVAFSPNNSRVITASNDGTARMWEAQTGAPVGAVMKHDDIVDCVAFSPDGLRVVTGSWDKMARLWDVSTPKVAAMSRERLLLISEVWSGFRVGEDGTQQHFSAGEFLELRRKLGDDDPLLQFQRERQVRFALGRALYAAQSAEDRRSGFAAAFHWRRLIQFRRALAEADPLDATKQLALMVSHSRLGEAQIQLDQYPAAIKQFRQGITVLDAMIEKKLLVESATREKAILQQRIEFCPTAALATGDWETLLKTDANDLPKLLSIRVTELGKRGRMADIAQAGGKLTELEPMTWDNFYNAARAYGLCATLVVNGKPTPTEAEQGEQKRFIDLSLACLKVAIAAGYDTFEHMRQDTDLTPLHGLPEFEALFPKKEQK